MNNKELQDKVKKIITNLTCGNSNSSYKLSEYIKGYGFKFTNGSSELHIVLCSTETYDHCVNIDDFFKDDFVFTQPKYNQFILKISPSVSYIVDFSRSETAKILESLQNLCSNLEEKNLEKFVEETSCITDFISTEDDLD